MKVLRIIRDYLCYCGISKEEYGAVKKEAYISNFKIWRVLHCLMSVIFTFLFVNALFDSLLKTNIWIYLSFAIYSLVSAVFFIFIMKKNSLIAQFWIYLSITLLLVFGCLLTLNNAEHPSTTFIVMLLITPLFMVDKPYFMGIELAVASVIYLVWMHGVKAPLIFKMDLVNVIAFSVSAFFIHVISNSIRIREFVLTRKINIQKDTDDLTGLKNKGALTREIDAFLVGGKNDKGILFILDIDRFKAINDTYGHGVGDDVIRDLGAYLRDYFTGDEIVGRFGGDEFVFFKKGSDDGALAETIAREVVAGVSEKVTLPDGAAKVSASIGIALYHGEEKNYSDLFTKADKALYEVKSKRIDHYKIAE